MKTNLVLSEDVELIYLRWFRNNINFGSNNNDLIFFINNQFEEQMNLEVPKVYKHE